MPYFFPAEYWKVYRKDNEFVWIIASLMSNVQHGFLTKSFSTQKSLFYTPPFFIIFKTSHPLENNFLAFKNFQKPNLSQCILAMVSYDENTNTFEPLFLPNFILPYNKSLSLNNVLEFYFVDSNNKIIKVTDLSQLFISITVP